MKPEPNASISPENALISDKPASLVDEFERLADKITPGEWHRKDKHDRLRIYGQHFPVTAVYRTPYGIPSEENADFIMLCANNRAHILAALRYYERKDAILGAIAALYEKYRFESCQEANDTAQNVIDDVLAAFDRQANHAK